jgi:hypothetical protein
VGVGRLLKPPVKTSAVMQYQAGSAKASPAMETRNGNAQFSSLQGFHKLKPGL